MEEVTETTRLPFPALQEKSVECGDFFPVFFPILGGSVLQLEIEALDKVPRASPSSPWQE
jgi:hypothetical protein